MKPMLISYQQDNDIVAYFSTPYDDRLLELDNKYVNVDDLADYLIIFLERLSHPLKTIDLTLYSVLITTGWF